MGSGLELVGCVLLLGAWFMDRHIRTTEKRANCDHVTARYISMDNAGVWWVTHCDECGWQEPYRVTRPPRHHPDDPKCIWQDECACGMSCNRDASRKR